MPASAFLPETRKKVLLIIVSFSKLRVQTYFHSLARKICPFYSDFYVPELYGKVWHVIQLLHTVFLSNNYVPLRIFTHLARKILKTHSGLLLLYVPVKYTLFQHVNTSFNPSNISTNPNLLISLTPNLSHTQAISFSYCEHTT